MHRILDYACARSLKMWAAGISLSALSYEATDLAGFAAVLRAEARLCSPFDLFKLEHPTGLTHAVSCNMCTLQVPGAVAEQRDDGSSRYVNSSAHHILKQKSSASLEARQGPSGVRRSFATGAVLQHSSDAPPASSDTEPRQPGSAIDIAASLASGAGSVDEDGPKKPHTHGRPLPADTGKSPEGVAELEQRVGDPGVDGEQEVFEDFVSLVRQRRRPAPPGTLSLEHCLPSA